METGVVLTATELEGCGPAADWSRWIREGKAPPVPEWPQFSAPEQWREDLDQLAGLGIGAVQLTLEWASLEPRPGQHDEAAVEARRDQLALARSLGLTVWGCLVDGTLPGWFAEDEGGFADDRARQLLWPRHVDWIGERFGDLVDGWVPQREAIRWALRRHLRGQAPPGQRDQAKADEAVRAAVLANGEAWRLLAGTAPVALYESARPVTAEPAPAGGPNVKAQPRAAALERALWHSWLVALTEGLVDVGGLPARQVEHLRGAFDRVIVELRPGIEVGADGRWRTLAPNHDSMATQLRRVADELGSHEVVAAGSVAEVDDDGSARPDHVQAVGELTADAANETSVVGWWQTSPIDGYHWERGTTLNPGIITADRRETPAAAKLRQLADT